MTPQKIYFWPWLFILFIILNMWCFTFVQASGSVLKQNLAAELGSFQKSIFKWTVKCDFSLELGVPKLCEVCALSVLFQKHWLLLSPLLTFTVVTNLQWQMCTGGSSEVHHHVNISRMSTCIMKTDIVAYSFNLFGCRLGKANQIDSSNLSSNC